MKIRVPVIVKDPEVSEDRKVAPTENITIEEEVFLDGPVSPRVAVLDFEPGNGALAPLVPFVAPTGKKPGGYDVPKISHGFPVDRAAAAVSVFGAVNKTMDVFEADDALGRKITWAFAAPQLLVVPRAGNWANAFYERESHSLQFFSFKSLAMPGMEIHTAHSQDIVAHETAHALLDGIAPDLYDAITPQSLAIHEAVADLAAVLVSLRSRELTISVLEARNGDISNSNVFSGIGEQFAGGLAKNRHYLRNLNNDKALRNPGNDPALEVVPESEPHALSEVLSGVFYRILLKAYDDERQDVGQVMPPAAKLATPAEESYIQKKVDPPADGAAPRPSPPSTGKALFIAGALLKRFLLRGLDYLPPGDVSFADLGRAVLASDQAYHHDKPKLRNWLVQEFVRRGVVGSAADLEVETGYEHEAVAALDVDSLISSDYTAYNFARRNLGFLGIPQDTAFEICPRLDVTKVYYPEGEERRVREVLFKARWSEVEMNDAGGGLPRQRRYRAGVTLAIGVDRAKPYVRALLRTRRLPSDRESTDALLKRLIAEERLHVSVATDKSRVPMRGAIDAEVGAGVLRIRGLARMLHIAAEERIHG